jgi:tetratricopeptide (TPR) repeat protein
MIRRLPLLLAAGALAMAFAGTVRADQTDPRLPALFDQLKQAPSSEAEAPIQQQIWAIWFVSGDPEIDRLMTAGDAAMTARDYGQALDLFNRVIAQRPAFAEGWNRRATLYYAMGEYRKSLADIDHVLTLEPRHFGALSGLGLVNIKLERMAAAADAYRRYLEIVPKNEDARQTLDMIDAVLKRQSI